jgi:hypothetical protein
MAARTLNIVIAGDAKGAVRAFQSTDRAAAHTERTVKGKVSSLGQSFKRVAVGATIGLAAAGVVAVKFGMDFVKAAEESQKVTKQTNAVLESTGGVARVTAGQVAKLSEQLSLKSGVDDELIQSGANVLLTFTKVRNEIGRGNDVFNQATRIALDMSVALGQDMQTSVIQLGKALNDPIRGLTSLRRVGVAFTEQQEKQIKKLVEAGDLLGAQKIILQELTTEFSGSAEAQATASDKLRVAWGNLQERLGKKLLPLVNAFSDWMTEKGIPAIESFASWIEDEAIPALQDLAGWLRDNVLPPLKTMGDVLIKDVFPAMQKAADWIGDRLNPALESLNGLLGDNNKELDEAGPNWKGWAVAIGVVAAALAGVAAAATPLVTAVKGVIVVFGTLGFAATMAFHTIVRALPFAHIIGVALIFKDRIADILSSAWRAVKNFFIEGGRVIKERWQESWDRITGTLRNWWDLAKAFFSAVWRGIRNFFVEGTADIRRRWSETWERVTATLRNWWDRTADFFRQLPGRFRDFFAAAGDWLLTGGKNIMRGMFRGIKNIWNDIIDWFQDLPGRILEILHIRSPPDWAVSAGRWIMRGFTKGLGLGVGSVWDFMSNLSGKFTGPLKDAWDSVFAFGTDIFGAIAGLFTGGPQGTSSRSNAMLGKQMAQSFGWTGSQWDALNKLVMSESGWSNTAQNPTSTAYGIGQFLDSTWATVGAQKTSDPGAQIAAMLSYIRQRYGDPISAWAFKQSHNWYGKGGVVPGPIGTAQPAVVHGGEGIFTPTQMRHLSVNGGGSRETVVNVSFAGAIIASEREAERWVINALKRAGENGRPITLRGRRL